MEWNNGKERKKFEKQQARLREEYRKAGMTEEQIKAMYEYDLSVFRKNRIEAIHTQRLDLDAFDDDSATDEGQNPLLLKFADKLTVELSITHTSRYAWVEDVENEKLAKGLKLLKRADLELLTLWLVDRYSQREIGELMGVTEVAISKRIAKLKKFLKEFLENG